MTSPGSTCSFWNNLLGLQLNTWIADWPPQSLMETLMTSLFTGRLLSLYQATANIIICKVHKKRQGQEPEKALLPGQHPFQHPGPILIICSPMPATIYLSPWLPSGLVSRGEHYGQCLAHGLVVSVFCWEVVNAKSSPLWMRGGPTIQVSLNKSLMRWTMGFIILFLF